MPEDVVGIFQSSYAIIDGHFRLRSGLHSDKYIAKGRVFTFPNKVSILAQEIAGCFSDLPIETVIGPAYGGISLAQWTAYHLSHMTMKDVRAAYTKKNGFRVGVGCEGVIGGRNVLVVDDVLTTGGSFSGVAETVEKAGGTVLGFGAVWNRGNCNEEMFRHSAFRFRALVTRSFKEWKESECPKCKEGILLNTEFGHGKS